MKLTLRTYQSDDDYWRIRDFLRQVMIANHCREFSWSVARWDYWWWFANPDLEKISLAENVFIWETPDGQIAAVLNPEGHGQVFLQRHPDFISPDLDAAMIALAEDRLTAPNQDDRRQLQIFVDSQDAALHQTLTQRGFQRVDRPGEQEYQHRRLLDLPLPQPIKLPDYTIRPLGAGLEFLERCYASGLGFHDDDIQAARDNRDHPDWYRHIQSAPLYRRDLDLVVIAPDGSVASFCTIWFDDVSRTAYFEPVATVPAHRQRGLGKAMMIEGLHCLKQMGCKVAFVGGYSPGANALYFSVMGPEYDVSEPWEKTI
ncbi:MAG TPA: GNAT family N-acetyltransferase [Anaerolineaceae bacterium]|nr:GNAT family N-acetyltransferase [Anaerolineaceae bacterium]HQH86434.1 GNAT family N-acetyltransferase [Anaerolineaceae bacterium]